MRINFYCLSNVCSQIGFTLFPLYVFFRSLHSLISDFCAGVMDNVLRGPLREILNSGLLVEDDRVLVEEKLHSGVAYRSSKLIIFLFICFGAFVYSLQISSEASGKPLLTIIY